jgi:hypothetical protein
MADPTPGNVGADTVVDSGDVSGTLNAHLLKGKLAEAELLLSYAVETGVQVDPLVSRSILEAGTASRVAWTEHAATNLLMAEATLAAILKPVSAESLRAFAKYQKSWVRRRSGPIATLVLATLIVLYSTAAFLFSEFSKNIRDNIAIANPLAVKLVDELGSVQVTNDKFCPNSESPVRSSQGAGSSDSSSEAGVHRKYIISDLQTFAAAIRDMYGGAQQLNRLYPFSSKQQDPIVPAGSRFTPEDYAKVLELPAGLPDLALAATQRICIYQRVRYYAQSTEESATILTGAVATSILPVLYALLGACAYVLRRLESQLRSRTYIGEAHSPRFLTAAIAGAVVGLFNFGQGVSVSPLAIAFLVGYAVDVFFTFLESMIETLKRGRGSAGSDQAAPGVKQ